jgi:hypothetical protein
VEKPESDSDDHQLADDPNVEDESDDEIDLKALLKQKQA